MSTNTNVVVIEGQREPTSITFGVVVVAIIFFGLVINYFWHILAILGLVFICLAVWRAESRTRRQQHALAARADHQNSQFLAGDPRGIYGDVQGLES